MEKIIISPAEVAETRAPAEQPARLEPRLASVVPWWAKVSLAPLVLVLPVLCLVVIVLRVAMRGLPPRTQHAWTAFFNTLLVVSGLSTSACTVLIFSLPSPLTPMPSLVSNGLSEVDERPNFPLLPATAPMSAKDVSENLKPLVAVISPVRHSWLNHQVMPGASLGAGTLLQANGEGYLFVTARHVVDGPGYNTKSPLNGLAAKWAAQNSHLLPIDPRPVAPPSDKKTGPTEKPAEEAVSFLQSGLVSPSHRADDPWSEKIVIDSES
jgi:hypothetical protein